MSCIATIPQKKGKVTNPFHQFLVKTFTHRLQAEGHSPEKFKIPFTSLQPILLHGYAYHRK